MSFDCNPRHRQPSTPSILPCVRIQNAPEILFVYASVNGQQGLFLVDTGAAYTFIDTCFAKVLGLETRALGRWQVRSNVSGKLKVAGVETLTVGNDIFDKFDVLVIDLMHMTKAVGRQIDGIIGLNVLSIAGCQIDPQQGRLLLHSSRSVDHPVPIVLEDRAMFINAQIDGRTIRMKVDTGSNHTTLSSAEWSRLVTSGVVTTNVRGAFDVNGYTTNKMVRELRCTCAVGNVIRRDFPVEEDDAGNLLGMDFLRHYIVTFDIKAGKAYFEDVAQSVPEVMIR